MTTTKAQAAHDYIDAAAKGIVRDASASRGVAFCAHKMPGEDHGTVHFTDGLTEEQVREIINGAWFFAQSKEAGHGAG